MTFFLTYISVNILSVSAYMKCLLTNTDGGSTYGYGYFHVKQG